MSERPLQSHRRAERDSQFVNSNALFPVENNYLRKSTASAIIRKCSAQNSLRTSSREPAINKKSTKPLSSNHMIRISGNDRRTLHEKTQTKGAPNFYGERISGQSNSLKNLLKYGPQNNLVSSPTSKLAELCAQQYKRASNKNGEPFAPSNQSKLGKERAIFASQGNFMINSSTGFMS